jgi:hypothetical protein
MLMEIPIIYQKNDQRVQDIRWIPMEILLLAGVIFRGGDRRDSQPNPFSPAEEEKR